MYRHTNEIDHYEDKAKKVMNLLSSAVNMNMDNLARETEMDMNEINEILINLQKSQYIEMGKYDHVQISKYGRKINNGEINVGYGPI